ncbi:MAG TPA: ATP-binding cassette domain-containing protein, partial [Vicinamibacteria bacterium]|nr:ATP-binding cassette domain-containing protein [Vicinamibacteria bacterium]
MRENHMTGRALEVADVRKTFVEGSQKVEVLRGVSLEVAAGEVVALEGPSGSGKTTLLSIAGCILTPSSGEVTIAGERVRASQEAQLREIRRRRIGFVFQQYNLFPALTALENVEYSLNVKGTRGRAAREEARRVLGQVGLEERLHFLPRD